MVLIVPDLGLTQVASISSENLPALISVIVIHRLEGIWNYYEVVTAGLET